MYYVIMSCLMSTEFLLGMMKSFSIEITSYYTL